MQASASENTWLRPSPDARPDRQVLVGDPFQVDHVRDGHAFGHALKDGYAGCLPEQTLGAVIVPTHWVSVRSTWGYKAPDIKSALVSDLHMTTRLHTVAESDRWLEVQHRDGRCFVPKHHCRDWLDWHRNPVDVARQYLGAPYVWAGNTGFGLDCSGLIQAVYHAIGWSCAADSQDQKDMPGTRPDEHQPGFGKITLPWKRVRAP
jgi:hypothetical protein